jgi:sterol desaturase/sphingolipid hydroxylase (fatty acid hydroxylase superfamily)
MTDEYIGKRLFENRETRRSVTFGAGRVNYWTTFVTDPLTVVFLISWEATMPGSSFLVLILGYAFGLTSWTLLEYAGHRWIYHKGRTPAHEGHKIHHRSPEVLIAMPWFVVTALFLTLWYVFAYRWQLPFVSVFMAGLLTGFVLYGAFHHVIHHRFNLNYSWYRKLRTQHFVHHQFPNVNFGVTSRFWDHIFGTTYKREKRQRGLHAAK